MKADFVSTHPPPNFASNPQFRLGEAVTLPAWTIHGFTAIQLACLIILWVVKGSDSIGILFPLFIAFLVPLRFSLKRLFRDAHLQALDAEELPGDEETQWV